MKKNVDLSKNTKNTPENFKPISQAQFINLIMQNNIDNTKTKIKNSFLENILSLYKPKYFQKYFRNTNYISKTSNNYKSSFIFNKNYLNSFLYSILFLFDDNKKLKDEKNILLKHYLLILSKLYKEKKIDETNLLIIIKFVIYLSIYERKDYPENKIILPKLKLIKNYQIFKYSIDIIKEINEPNITKEYINFLNIDLIKYKPNLFIITKRVDMLELINYKDHKDYIIQFLANLYSFKYSKLFLDVFINKINDIYDIKNKGKKTIEILNYLNRDIMLLSQMQKIEKKKYKEDPYILSHGFVINNNEKSKIMLKEIIIISNFSMIFSFCYSPDEKDNKLLDESINKGKTNKNINNIPIIDLIKEDQSYNEVTGFSFYIRDNFLYHRKFNSSEEIKLCNIIENKTYICYYSIMEYEQYIIHIKSEIDKKPFTYKDKFKSFLKSKLNLQAGKFFNSSTSCFDGYIGPILLFKCCLTDEQEALIFGLKGSYEKSLFFEDYNFNFTDKYDKDVNCPLSPKKDINNFNFCRKALKEKKINIKENLIFFLTPIYDGSSLNKKEYTHSTLKECKIIFGANPRPEGGATFFFKNLFTPFEFLKYEGINFLILIIELIVSNIDNIERKKEADRIIILNLFSELIPYIQELIYLLNVKYYEDEIRHILFALEKCINKMCKKFKMCSEIGHQLNNWIISLTSQQSNHSESFIKIRNEISKFLLNTELYDMNEYSCIEFFFSALNSCLNSKPDGLINMEFFQKIISFTYIFKLVTRQKNIRKTRQFSSFKNEMITLIITFLRRSGYIAPYMHIYKKISDSNIYDFRKYQFIKIFYLESKYYFDNISNDKGYISTWKYFISLFKYLQSRGSFPNLTQNQVNILMALCLRIIIEYPIIGNFFKENKFKNKKRQKTPLHKIIKKRNSAIFPNNYSKNNDTFDIKRDKEKREKKKDENKNRNKRSNSSYKSFEYKIEKYGIKVTNKDQNQKEKLEQNIDFFTYKTLVDTLESSYKLNDYIFRALLLLILENNNNVIISQEIKLKFITKVKKYDHLKNKEFASFLKLSYINRETKTQLIKLTNMVTKNVKNITHITYDIFLYLIIQACEKRKQDKCTFNHLIKSKKICTTILLTALNNDKEAYNLFMTKYSDLIIYTLSYHKQPFLTELLYDVLISKNKILRQIGQSLVNVLLLVNEQEIKDMECFYHIKINSIILMYRIIKSNDFLKYANQLFLKEQAILELFNINLVSTKMNIFKSTPIINKKKCYIEALFEIMLFLCIYTNKQSFYSLTIQMFIENIKYFKKTNNESKTIVYFIDEIKGQGEKGNKALKIFSKTENIDVPCLSLQFLLKTLKYFFKCANTNIKSMLKSLVFSFYNDTFYIFQKHSSKKKKNKNKVMYNFLYEYIKNHVSMKKPSVEEKIVNTLISSFTQKYTDHLNIKKRKLDAKKQNEEGRNRSFISTQIKELYFFKNDDEDELNDSFSSCKSSKEVKNICANNQKKICVTINKRKNFLKKFNKKKNKEDIIDSDENEDNICNTNTSQTNVPTSEQDFSKSNINNLISTTKKEKDFSSILFNINNEKNPFSLDKIEYLNKVILFPKSTLMEQIFSIYFIKRLFYNKPFIKLKQYYKYYIKKNHNIEIKTNDFFNYPIIMKNYISNNLYFGGLFLKHDLDFFTNPYIEVSHPYFKERLKDSIQKRIFKKISDQDDINKFLKDNSKKKNEFYVDLVTNRNVVFGKLIVNKYLLYFENIDRQQFLKEKTDKEKIDFLLCSQECDYSTRNKKLYIFKREITEIINRRFLYSFQACEIYLKNGKSYYFNFYSEDKKIKFISLFAESSYTIKIISDLKSEFKNKGFTNKWLNNQISTLAYLLFINKYSCRSYNDINQYPIFPWLIIYNDKGEDKERDLKYTITAQDEDTRMMLKEKYPFSSTHFPYHYTTHYSNSSFLIYYLIRINPFTDNQIKLQVNKFDVPNRQFNSLDELLHILYTTKQPREVIPEFFMSTEFFYNYNCNYFGAKADKTLVNDLINKKKFTTPLEYVLNNEVLIESPKYKSRINFFFDNIFGTGQMGGCDKCNTYDKYSYQEMIDLNEKIKKFKENKLTYEEIKRKITMKSNKIISFGQTPFKLFEDIHPQWTPEKNNKEDELKIDENFNDMKKRFIYFNFNKNINGKKIFYILANNENMAEIKFYDQKIKDDKHMKVIKTKKRLKLCSKFYLDNQKNKNFVSLYKYNPKFIMINFNFSLFIFGRLKESCFCIFNKSGDSFSYFVESIVYCIAKSVMNNFFIGLENGKILEFKLVDFDPTNNNGIIDLNYLKIKLERSYIAHKKRVSGIYYSDLLELIISSGDDRKIFIRKYYDLSLLTVINIEDKFCIDIKIKHYYLYILLYDEEKKAHIVEVRSVNGLIMKQTGYHIYNNIDFDKEGNLLIGLAKEKIIEVYNPALTKRINVISLNQLTLKKKNKQTQEIKVEDNFFLNFTYQRENSSIYCYFSNGNLIQKNIDL